MKNQYEGCAVNFDGKVLRFRLDKSSGEMEFQSRFKFMIKDKEYKESESKHKKTKKIKIFLFFKSNCCQFSQSNSL